MGAGRGREGFALWYTVWCCWCCVCGLCCIGLILSMMLLMYSWDGFNGNGTAVWDEVGVLTHVTDLLYCATVQLVDNWSTIGGKSSNTMCFNVSYIIHVLPLPSSFLIQRPSPMPPSSRPLIGGDTCRRFALGPPVDVASRRIYRGHRGDRSVALSFPAERVCTKQSNVRHTPDSESG
jgi:hypothetical protein